jgi:hypothetical protein
MYYLAMALAANLKVWGSIPTRAKAKLNLSVHLNRQDCCGGSELLYRMFWWFRVVRSLTPPFPGEVILVYRITNGGRGRLILLQFSLKMIGSTFRHTL